MSTENEYSFNSIKTDMEEAKESTIFFSPLDDERYSEINLDTALREQVSANTANIAKHEEFISENIDVKETVSNLEIRIEEFDNFNYVVHDDFNGNIINRESIDDLEKIVNDLRQIVYELVRDYGTHLNTGDLKYQNQIATETIEELNKILTDSKENILPIRDVVGEVKDARLSYFGNRIENNLKERLIQDFKVISDKLDELEEFEQVKDVINDLQNQINDIIENGVRQDIIEDIYKEIDAIKKDIEWMKENGWGGGGTDPVPPEADLPDAGIIQECLNVFLITNTTLFRMRSVVEENEGLIDYILFQIAQGNLTAEKIFECYPYLEEKIRSRVISRMSVKYSLNKNMASSKTVTELTETYADDIIDETPAEKLNRLVQDTLNVFIKTNATTVRTREVIEEEKKLVDYLVVQIIEGRLSYEEVCEDYKHLEIDIYNKYIEMGGEL